MFYPVYFCRINPQYLYGFLKLRVSEIHQHHQASVAQKSNCSSLMDGIGRQFGTFYLWGRRHKLKYQNKNGHPRAVKRAVGTDSVKTTKQKQVGLSKTLPSEFLSFVLNQKCISLQIKKCWLGTRTYLMLLASAIAAEKDEVDEESFMDLESGPKTRPGTQPSAAGESTLAGR